MMISKAMIGILVTATLATCGTTRPWRVFTATAYSVKGVTASGERPREGVTVAADPDVLPIGTKIEVRGAGEYSGTYTVLDSGAAIDGREIDIYMKHRADAKEFGRQKVRVRVLELPKEVAEQK